MSLFNPNQQPTYPMNGYQPNQQQVVQTPYQPPVVNQPQYQTPQPQQQVVAPVPGQMIQGQTRGPSMSVAAYRKGSGKIGKDMKYTDMVNQIQIGDKVYFGSQQSVYKHLPWITSALEAKGISIRVTKPEWQNGRNGSIKFYTSKPYTSNTNG